MLQKLEQQEDREKMIELLKDLVIICLKKRSSPNTEPDDLNKVPVLTSSYKMPYCSAGHAS